MAIDEEKLREALKAVADDNRRYAQWEYDTLKCLKHEAKIELCEELARALGLSPL